MKFWEAMKALEEGKKVKAKGWPIGFFISSRGYYQDISLMHVIECANREWEIYEEPEKTYSFMEVVQGLKEGKRFRRKSWNEWSILKCEPTQEILGYLRMVNQKGQITTLFLEDFEANDWIEYHA